VDQERDKDEWQKFLTLLARFRKKEPLNGLVVTIAADRLAQASAETLREDGRTLRKRIEELTRVLGARSPVYVLVTKCNLIQGATHFCEQLPESSLNQAMGYVNQGLAADAAGVIAKAVATVGDRLRELRLQLLHRLPNRGAAAAMLLFPEELEKLKDGLSAFAQTIFQENPYQETPLLRGIFFSSGRQEGTPFSHFLSALGLIHSRDVLKGTNKGLFLHDFFARILPADRALFRPTSHMQEWRRLTRNLGLTAWIALVVAACGLLSYSFVKNLNALSDVRREFDKPTLLQGELMADIMTMDRFREAVLQVERGNRNWWIPRLGLNESLEMETALKQKYVELFQNGFLQSFDKGMADRMTTFEAGTPGPVFGAHVAHLVRRINLLKARLSQEDLVQLSARPQPPYGSDLVGRGEVIPEMQKKIGEEYLYALYWSQDGDRLKTELTHLQTWLKHLMTRPGLMLNWLVDWVNSEPDLTAVTLQEFWGGETGLEAATVPPAFTQAGKDRIDAALAEIQAALFDPLIVAAPKADFSAWYEKNYVAAWQTFGLSFD
jgi:type VI secretion system protein ImpL